jgi:hypothetical protein
VRDDVVARTVHTRVVDATVPLVAAVVVVKIRVRRETSKKKRPPMVLVGWHEETRHCHCHCRVAAAAAAAAGMEAQVSVVVVAVVAVVVATVVETREDYMYQYYYLHYYLHCWNLYLHESQDDEPEEMPLPLDLLPPLRLLSDCPIIDSWKRLRSHRTV